MGLQTCPKCARQVAGKVGACEYCGAVLVARVPCPGCKREVNAALPKCQYCGTAIAAAPATKPCPACKRPTPAASATCAYCGVAIAPANLAAGSTTSKSAPSKPALTAAQALAVASVAGENRTRAAYSLSPEQVMSRHLTYSTIGLVVFAAITFWQPAGTGMRLLVVFGGPLAYAVLLLAHYKVVNDHDDALIGACEDSAGRFWLVTGTCFVVGAVGLLVILTHLGLIRPSSRRPQAMWNTLIILLAAGAASIYFVWFGIKLLRARAPRS